MGNCDGGGGDDNNNNNDKDWRRNTPGDKE